MKKDILEQGRPNAEGRFDTSATSLTNSMSLHTDKHQRLLLVSNGEARRGEFPSAWYPWFACVSFVFLWFHP